MNFFTNSKKYMWKTINKYVIELYELRLKNRPN